MQEHLALRGSGRHGEQLRRTARKEAAALQRENAFPECCEHLLQMSFGVRQAHKVPTPFPDVNAPQPQVIKQQAEMFQR